MVDPSPVTTASNPKFDPGIKHLFRFKTQPCGDIQSAGYSLRGIFIAGIFKVGDIHCEGFLSQGIFIHHNDIYSSRGDRIHCEGYYLIEGNRLREGYSS